MNYTSLFEILLDASDSTRAAIFNAINFTGLFDIVQGLSLDAKTDIFKAIDFGAIFDAVKNSNIDRAQALKGKPADFRLAFLFTRHVCRADGLKEALSPN